MPVGKVAKPITPELDLLPPVRWASQVLGRWEGQETHELWLRKAIYGTLLSAGLPLPRFDLPVAVLAVGPLPASINHNRWIVNCPFCAGAEGLWDPDDWFFCCSCGNKAVGGQRIAVAVPRESAEIEAALGVRPDVKTRNWQPLESIEDLWSENRQYGLPTRVAVLPEAAIVDVV